MSILLVNQEKPVTVEHLPGDIVLIQGVRYSGDIFRTMVMPNNDTLYAICRDGEVVILKQVRNVDEAKTFFEESGQDVSANEMENEDGI